MRRASASEVSSGSVAPPVAQAAWPVAGADVEGPPDDVAKTGASYTGRYLKPVLDAHAGRRTRGTGVAAQAGTPAARNGRGRKASGDLLS